MDVHGTVHHVILAMNIVVLDVHRLTVDQLRAVHGLEVSVKYAISIHVHLAILHLNVHLQAVHGTAVLVHKQEFIFYLIIFYLIKN